MTVISSSSNIQPRTFEHLELDVAMDEEKEEQLRLKSVYGIGLSLVVFIVAGLIFLFLSPIYHVVAYDIYIKSMSVGDVRYVLMALSGLLLLLFHSVDGYSWPSTPRLLGVLFVLYMFLAAVLSTAELYPGAVLITALAQFPILLGACGEVTSLSTRDFHRIVSVSCFLAGVLVMGLWVGWIYAVDMQWNDQTKAKLRGEWMVDVYRVMRVSDWSLCETVRSMKSISPASIDESGIDMLAKCSKIELTYFLIWTCPLFVCGALMVIFAPVNVDRPRGSLHDRSDVADDVVVSTAIATAAVPTLWKPRGGDRGSRSAAQRSQERPGSATTKRRG